VSRFRTSGPLHKINPWSRGLCWTCDQAEDDCPNYPLHWAGAGIAAAGLPASGRLGDEVEINQGRGSPYDLSMAERSPRVAVHLVPRMAAHRPGLGQRNSAAMRAGLTALDHRRDAAKLRRLAELEEEPIKRLLGKIAELHDRIADRLDALNKGQQS
jgi:hypothetical protein